MRRSPSRPPRVWRARQELPRCAEQFGNRWHRSACLGGKNTRPPGLEPGALLWHQHLQVGSVLPDERGDETIPGDTTGEHHLAAVNACLGQEVAYLVGHYFTQGQGNIAGGCFAFIELVGAVGFHEHRAPRGELLNCCTLPRFVDVCQIKVHSPQLLACARRALTSSGWYWGSGSRASAGSRRRCTDSSSLPKP